ncbi:hypothetical protein FRB93_002747 [Tulasnella sp. JGI-2019a]|nr:hypothetical protein FRB93_002747 [Tulasnella sp. JGI-2019a]
MTGPNRALSIPELLLWTLEYLSAEELMVAALVCKVWSAPATDIRWRTQTITLSRLFAKLAPINKNYHERYAVLAPQIPISQDDWCRFLERYANRVTKLNFDIEFDINSLMLISTLLETFGRLLCSSLTSLTWPTSSAYEPEDCPKLLDLLTVTKLQTVEYADSISLLQLAHRAAHIQEIAGPRYSKSFNFSVFSQLRSLSYVGYLSTTDYHNLTRCTHLKVLHLWDTRAGVTSLEQNNSEAITFPHLEEFLIDTCNNAADRMILRSAMPALHSLDQRRMESISTIPS